MIRILLTDSDIVKEDIIELRDYFTLKHLKALRPAAGEVVEALNGDGIIWRGIFSKQPKGVFLTDIQRHTFERKTPMLYLFVSLIPHNRFGIIIDRASEFGADCVIPIFTERSLIKPSETGKKMQRWNRIARESLKQCGNPFLLRVNEPMHFSDALSWAKERELPMYIAGLAYKNEDHLMDVLAENPSDKVAVFIGPEGDFSGRELDMAQNMGARGISLGDNTLRVETAAAYVCGIAAYLKTRRSTK